MDNNLYIIEFIYIIGMLISTFLSTILYLYYKEYEPSKYNNLDFSLIYIVWSSIFSWVSVGYLIITYYEELTYWIWKNMN